MGIPSLEDLMGAEVGSNDFPLIPAGTYNGVITKSELRKGNKAPYIALMVTIHDEDYKGWTVWNSAASFSEKAQNIPGHAANLVQSVGLTKDDVPLDADPEEVPGLIAAAILNRPVQVEVVHDQVVRNGVPQTLDDGSPEMRAHIDAYATAPEEFIESVELDAQGLDDDLPF